MAPSPAAAEAYLHRGVVRETLGRRIAAVADYRADYRKALRVNPNYRKAAIHLKRMGVAQWGSCGPKSPAIAAAPFPEGAWHL